mgnify:CR=1 FL=1
MRKTVIIVLATVLILLIGAGGALYWASKNAAVIANEIAIEQKVLKGKITVHKLEVGLLGNIDFQNFVWLDPAGKLVAEIPKGSIKINLRDALTGNFNSKSLEKIEFDNAVIHLVFNDKMELNVLNLSRDRQDNNKQDSAPKEKADLNVELLLKNSTLSATYVNRHFSLEGTNADIKLDTGSELKLNIKTNKVTGNIAAEKVELNGKINLQPKVPVYDLVFNVGSVIPSSISAGIDINEPLTISSKITGELPNPVINGSFAMANLSMSPLVLDNLKGVFRYNNAVLNITESSANTYGGSVQATGNVNIDSKNFSFNVAGQGLNSTQVADDKISGPLDFTLLAQSSADGKSLSANGHFYIGEGKFSGIPFKSMEGDFSRYSGKMSFSNIVIRTIAGNFTTNMLQNSLGKIQLGAMTPAFVENAIKDELTKKGRDLIKGLFR